MAKDSLDKIIASVRKKFGDTSAQRLGTGRASAASTVREVIPTGIEVLDRYLLGIGGLPVGRMIEVFSPEGGGKTTLGYQCIASAQRDGCVTVWIDAGGVEGFDEERAAAFGVDLDKLILLPSENLEMVLESMKLVLAAHDAKHPILFVWDSIASTKTKAGQLVEAGSFKMGETPRIMSEELPKIVKLLGARRGVLLALNQIRMKLGVMFGNPETTPGGNAVKFYASFRMQFYGGKAVKDAAGAHVGKDITFTVVKTRFTPPWRKARVRLNYATGFDNQWTTLEHAKTLKLIDPRKTKGAKGHQTALVALGWGGDVTKTAAPAGTAAVDEEE